MSEAARAFLGRPFTSAGSVVDVDTLESLLDAFAAEQTAAKDAEIARLREAYADLHESAYGDRQYPEAP